MFGEFDEMVLYHAILIKVLLGVFVIGMVIPFLSAECSKTIKRTRIYMFVSHGLITMVAFAGMVAFVFAQMDINIEIVAMIVAFLAMIGIEVVKYRKILKGGTAEGCAKKARVTAVMFGLLNIAIIAAFVVYKVMEAKSAIPAA